MITSPEASVLLSLPGFSLSGPGLNPNTGVLDLESVSVPNPDSTRGEERSVYLVLRLNNFETPIDPMCAVTRTDEPKARVYKFSGTPINPNEFTLSVNGPFIAGDEFADKLEAFENILEQYVDEYRTTGAGAAAFAPLTTGQANTIKGAVQGDKDLRGHLVMINEDTGEIIGQVEDRFKIHEDASMHARGNEHEPVVIHVPDEYSRESDRHALEVFATIIPPEQRNWISTSANIVSHAISMTTNLLITTINTGASYYMNHSAPSPHHPSVSGSTTPNNTTNTKGAPGTSTPNGAPPLPPRALTFLTSDRTRKNLSSVHALSGQAVKVSNKTVALIDNMIRRAMGAKPKRERYFPTGISASGSNPNLLDPNAQRGVGAGPSRSPSPSHSPRLVPPPYMPGGSNEKGGNEKSGYGVYPPDKPALPPRRSPSPASPAYRSVSPSGYKNPSGVPYQTYQPQHHHQYPQQPIPQQPQPQLYQPQPQRTTTQGPPLPERKLKTKDHILISADLILSTIDDSARRVLDAGTEQLGKVVGHKYGAQAAESSLYMAGTARNVGLVYIDMSGIGRRALLKRAGKTFLKARVSSKDPNPYPVPGQVPPSPAPQR